MGFLENQFPSLVNMFHYPQNENKRYLLATLLKQDYCYFKNGISIHHSKWFPSVEDLLFMGLSLH